MVEHPTFLGGAKIFSSIGYHYYMTPETAAMGLQKLSDAITTTPKQWSVEDWPDLTEMKVFKKNRRYRPLPSNKIK